MKKLTLLFGVLVCLVAVNARHFGDRHDESIENEDETLRRPNRDHNLPPRYRRRRWQSYGYDYQPPSFYYPDRRDYDRTSQELLQQISKLLEELSSYIRRPPPPPPPPQPIYIPYPMFLNYPQIGRLPCRPQNKNKTDEKLPETPKRGKFDEMDPNRNWGFAVSSESDYDYPDGARPISFDPVVPNQIMKRPAPDVEHGSVQASVQSEQAATKAPVFEKGKPVLSARLPAPGMCNAAILSCCDMSNSKAQKSQCFSNIGCSDSFNDGNACSNESVQRALESFRVAYSPVN